MAVSFVSLIPSLSLDGFSVWKKQRHQHHDLTSVCFAVVQPLQKGALCAPLQLKGDATFSESLIYITQLTQFVFEWENTSLLTLNCHTSTC